MDCSRIKLEHEKGVSKISTTIYTPKRIKVGFNKRSDTYTGKLAYVIYYDEKGKLRKETSWNNWRNHDIPDVEFDNVPTKGFVLNKKVGDYSGDWGAHRQAYCRIYDPRDFEFEITINNLLFILENCSCSPGKGLDGEFVYGWDGKDLVLLPVNSPDYKEINNYSNLINTGKTFKGNDLIVGATYLTKDNEEWVYMGKFDIWDLEHQYIPSDSWGRRLYHSEVLDDTWFIDKYNSQAYKNIYKGKGYWFINQKEEYKWNRVKHFKSVSSKIISLVDDKCVQNYTDLYAELETCTEFSPIDYECDQIIDMEYEDFKNCANTIDKWPYHVRLYSKTFDGFTELKHGEPPIFTTNKEKQWYCEYGKNSTTYQLFGSLEEAYRIIHPLIRKRYLKNGTLYNIDWLGGTL